MSTHVAGIMQEIRKIKISDKDYPLSLKNIEEPPSTLYIRGEIPQGPCLAIVGTRRCSAYGKQVALEIAAALAETGFAVVSGMAKGIDTYSHKGCLEAGGKTIAVLGTGLDEESIYPQENLKLSQEIIEKEGCLMSEYPPGTPGYKSNFPTRNRIISGLSLGVLVVEAKLGSGSLITANWAKQQKRKVFAVPGPIHAANSKGTHLLIKRGAILVENANDVLKELGLKCTSSDLTQKIQEETPQENRVLEALKEKPLHVEKIIEATGLPVSKILSILVTMEIKGQIRNLGGNIFALRR